MAVGASAPPQRRTHPQSSPAPRCAEFVRLVLAVSTSASLWHLWLWRVYVSASQVTPPRWVNPTPFARLGWP